MEYVLMADIIDSSSKNGMEVMDFFKDLVNKTNKKFKDKIISPLTITLGDEFQGIVSDLKSVLEIIFYMEECLVSSSGFIQLRYVMNYGEIESKINRKSSHEMLGDGLSKARKILNDLKKSKLKYAFSGLGEKSDKELNLVFSLIQTLYEDWPDKDLEVVSEFIRHKDYKIVADKIKKDSSSTWRKERTLRMKDYFNLKELSFEVIK